MSRIGKGTSYPETVSFRTVVDEALLLLRGAIVEAEAEIRITGASAVFHADRVRLVEIWQNLIDNALKYRQPDIPVHIDIGLDYGDGAPVFFVRDNGIGIEPRYHQKIFGLFDQLNPGMQGSGVGLALVKRIVELYGGNIWVESGEQRQGTCFRFTLPGALAKGEKA
jgi:signal transduction histidine kinase